MGHTSATSEADFGFLVPSAALSWCLCDNDTAGPKRASCLGEGLNDETLDR